MMRCALLIIAFRLQRLKGIISLRIPYQEEAEFLNYQNIRLVRGMARGGGQKYPPLSAAKLPEEGGKLISNLSSVNNLYCESSLKALIALA